MGASSGHWANVIYAEYEQWFDSLSPDKATAKPDVDLEDHEAVARVIWTIVEIKMRQAADIVLAALHEAPSVDARELDDPNLSAEAMLAQMQAAAAEDF